MLKYPGLSIGLALGLLAPVPAFAHAALKQAQPAAGATVPSPHEIVLTFSEGVVPKLSGLVLGDPAGKPVATGAAAGGTSATALVVPITAPLAPGTYTVTWHAVSVDSHRTKGSFRFTVRP